MGLKKMEDNLKEIFHALFNKINNICLAAGSNKKILEEDINKLSDAEAKERISYLIQVFGRIEDNIRSLDENLRQLYESLK